MTEPTLTKMPHGKWETYTLDTDEDMAAQRFAKKHGHPPAQVLDVVFAEWRGQPWGLLLCGPIENGRNGDDVQK